MASLSSVAGSAEHALYILLDSNLPTGGFVASSGLESYAKHGFLAPSRAYGVAGPPDLQSSRTAAGREWGGGGAVPRSAPALGTRAGPALADFAAAEVANFEASTGWYLRASWDAAQAGAEVDALVALDEMHDATLLSHVARRASRAQGVALLTMYARGLAPPDGEGEAWAAPDGAAALVAAYRRAVRRGAPGHLAVCFGAVAAALGLARDTAHHLYLFTHARSLLSSGVRLNVVGPYLSTQLLAHPLRTTIAAAMESDATLPPDDEREGGEEGEWAWADEAERGPATTWPLGEILAARHDLQHSRIFNS